MIALYIYLFSNFLKFLGVLFVYFPCTWVVLLCTFNGFCLFIEIEIYWFTNSCLCHMLSFVILDPKKEKKKRFQPNQNFKEVRYWFLKLKEVSAIRINQKDKR